MILQSDSTSLIQIWSRLPSWFQSIGAPEYWGDGKIGAQYVSALRPESQLGKKRRLTSRSSTTAKLVFIFLYLFRIISTPETSPVIESHAFRISGHDLPSTSFMWMSSLSASDASAKLVGTAFLLGEGAASSAIFERWRFLELDDGVIGWSWR